MDVASAASPAAELDARIGETSFEEGCGCLCCAAGAGLGCPEGVAGATTAGVDVVAGGGVWLSDGVLEWHLSIRVWERLRCLRCCRELDRLCTSSLICV